MGTKELFRISSKYQGTQEIWIWGIKWRSRAQSIGRVTPDCLPAWVYVDPAAKTLRQLPTTDRRYVENLSSRSRRSAAESRPVLSTTAGLCQGSQNTLVLMSSAFSMLLQSQKFYFLCENPHVFCNPTDDGIISEL